MGKDDHQVNSLSQVAVNGLGLVSYPVAIATRRPRATQNQQVLCGVGFAKIDLARVAKRVLYGEAVLSGGLLVLVTGLSRREGETKAHCDCTWHF